MSVGSGGLDISNHVNAPHCKWPQSSHDVQRDRRHMYFVNIDLALVTSSRVVMEVSFHSRPIVTRSQKLLSHSMSTGMSTKNTSVHIFHNILCLFLIHTRSKVESWLHLYNIPLLRKHLAENLRKNFLSLWMLLRDTLVLQGISSPHGTEAFLYQSRAHRSVQVFRISQW